MAPMTPVSSTERELSFDCMNDVERSILTELVRFGHSGTPFASGSLDSTRPRTIGEIVETRLSPSEVHELCAFARAAAGRGIAVSTGHRPDLYDAEDFFAWCFEPEPENRRPGPRVSISAADADHARQLLRSIERNAALRELFRKWDAWRRTGRELAQHRSI